MAKRDSSYQPSEEKRSLATGWNARNPVELPLLPYERELIAALGCTQEEYEAYKKELVNYGKRRPSEYAHIPDVRNDPISIVVSLVVGLALTAVSALLAPKPQKPEQKEDRRKKLADDVSGTRFNQTQGFNGSQSVASLGTPVPAFFGKREGNFGGLFIQPQLVWSRMFSYGTHQGFLGAYVVGETLETAPEYPRTDTPDLAGIQLGTGPLSAVDESQFAIYWRSNYQDGRLKRTDLIYGTDGYPAAGNPNPNNDILGCPIKDNQHGPGFSMSFAPSGDTTFGVYSPVRNGNGWKLNFRIISFPNVKSNDKDPNNRIQAERAKIVGRQNTKRGEGMRGTGAGYAPFMGIIAKGGGDVDAPQRKVTCRVGDEITFIIRGKEITKDEYKGSVFGGKESSDVGMEEITNQVDTFREDADDTLVVGELFMIGRTMWQVRSRSGGNNNGAFEPGKNDVRVTLRMVETTTNDGASAIGIAGRKATGGQGAYIQTWDGYDASSDDDGWLGPAFWPLLRCSFANIKNTRPVESTEFGIKSQVWNQANGLCNFASLLQPAALADLEEEEYSIQSGTQTKYFTRTSCFTVYLRPVGVQDDGTAYPWAFLGETFCISGSQPIDQYNFLRFKCNDGPRQMEFRFIPRSFSDIQFYVSNAEPFWRLNAKTGTEIGQDFVTNYGVWRVTTVGEIVTAAQIKANREMIQEPTSGSARTERQVTGVNQVDLLPASPTTARFAAWKYEVFGDPRGREGREATGEVAAAGPTGTVRIKCYARCIYSPFPDYSERFCGNSSANCEFWDLYRYEVLPNTTTGNPNNGDKLNALKNVSGGNYFASYAGITNGLGVVFQVTATRDNPIVTPGNGLREFETTSQLAEISNYTEVTKSCATSPEHTITYINEAVGPLSDRDVGENDNAGAPTYPFTMMGLALRSSNAIDDVEQLNVWLRNGVSTRLNAESDGGSKRGPSNLFADAVHYLLTNEVGGLGQTITPDFVDRGFIEITAKFQKANGIFFDAAIPDRVNARSYLTDLAPFNLCNFVIKDGVFTTTPALPYNDAYKIDPFAVNVQGFFNEHNILEGSYTLNYLDVSERNDFKAVVKYRNMITNLSPTTRTVMVRWNDVAFDKSPMEEIDLSSFCTSRDHALMVARFLLSIRRRIDHSVQFKTDPKQLGLEPGSLIVLATTSAPESSTVNGVVNADNGGILCTDEFNDGTYEVSMYVPAREKVEVVQLEVKNNRAVNPELWGSVFSLITPREDQTLYQIEAIELDADGMADITATHFPAVKIDGRWKSTIAEDVLDENGDLFYVIQ